MPFKFLGGLTESSLAPAPVSSQGFHLQLMGLIPSCRQEEQDWLPIPRKSGPWHGCPVCRSDGSSALGWHLPGEWDLAPGGVEQLRF